MGILRSFLYVIVAPFHPIWAFGRMDEDPSSKLVTRSSLWLTMLIQFVLFYFMMDAITEEDGLPPAFNTASYIFIKLVAVGIFLFLMAIIKVILALDSFELYMITAVLGLSMLPEILFLLLTYYFPQEYVYFKFFAYIWRTIIICIGIMVLSGASSKQTIIMGVICSIALYFANYNYFI